MPRPFHYAFVVKDLDSTRSFYADLLGCPVGRSSGTWIDFDFFGNQISAHMGEPPSPSVTRGIVDDVRVPMPHFGAILEWGRFHEIAHRLREARVPFLIEPTLRYEGKPGEQMTMFLSDPSGNHLEFKAFRNESEVFETRRAES